MKRTLIGLFTCFAIASTAQTWIDFGIKGGYGPSILLNKNFFDDNEFSQRMVAGYTLGGKIGLNFGNRSEVTLDVMRSETNFLFDYNVYDPFTDASPLYQKKFVLQSVDFLVLYRLHGKQGNYFEIGPQISMITHIEGSSTYPEPNDGNVPDNITENYAAIALGFGQYIIGNERLSVTAGARFTYGISDLISAEGKAINYPACKQYDNYYPSHPFGALVMLELNYDLGYLSNACSKRVKLILF